MFDEPSTQPRVLSFDTSTATTRGQRDYQQDSSLSHFPFGQSFGYAVVADGMGGCSAGHVASALATLEIFSRVRLIESDIAGGQQDIPSLLRNLATDANARILSHSKQDKKTQGMGTTLLMPLIRDNQLFWISVGDSPLFLFRDGALRQLNQDHSLAPQIDMMAKMGVMDADIAAKHPDRCLLTSVLNGEPIPTIDCPHVPLALKPDDILIAASDGLQTLSDAEIANKIGNRQHMNAGNIAKALLDAVIQRNDPHQDNATIVVTKLMTDTQQQTVANLDTVPHSKRSETDANAPSDAAHQAEPVLRSLWSRGAQLFKESEENMNAPSQKVR